MSTSSSSVGNINPTRGQTKRFKETWRSGTKREARGGKWNSSSGLGLFCLLVLLNLTALVFEQTEASSEAVIKITRFQVPSQVRAGEHRRLACLYELQGATLHAMKLFKDNKEFYRYTPADHKMTFPVVGVQVDLQRSGEREVWIRTGKRSGGSYKCQVSIEGTFNSVLEEKRMEVVEGPAGSSNWHQREASNQQRLFNQNNSPTNNNNNNRAQPVQKQQMTFAGAGATAAAAATTTGRSGWSSSSGQPAASLSHQFHSSSAARRPPAPSLALLSNLLVNCLVLFTVIARGQVVLAAASSRTSGRLETDKRIVKGS